MKVVSFNNRVTPSGLYQCNQVGDNSGEYVPLAEYQELEDKAIVCANDVIRLVALLRRWNEIAPDLAIDTDTYDEDSNSYILAKSPELAQLIQDTQETLS